eukprot:snap_masked-scaffold_67-processed-gene-0.36-mRNA-1 protein AED:1.00 eAED:1.00 QI:0/-1/0/0/-1/1/1/0/59
MELGAASLIEIEDMEVYPRAPNETSSTSDVSSSLSSSPSSSSCEHSEVKKFARYFLPRL